jgi:hypothetical protein
MQTKLAGKPQGDVNGRQIVKFNIRKTSCVVKWIGLAQCKIQMNS